MAQEISSAGVSVKYAVETTSGTKPSTFTAIPNVKDISGVSAEPSTYEVTDLSDTKYKRYIPALKDMGGNISLTVNLTDAFKTAWEALVSAYESGKSSGKATWFEFVIPGITEAFFICGMPSELGFPDISTDSVIEATAYITPNVVNGWDTKI